MGEEEKKDKKPTPTQRERWIKYGSNVAISIVLIIALAVLCTHIAQVHLVRIDTTAGGTQSLRPQTLDFIRDLDKKVRVIALYHKLKNDTHEQDYYQPVADLLTDYASKNRNITTEIFDPDSEKEHFDHLVAEVTNRYGGEVQGYKAVTDNLQKSFNVLGKFATDESAKFLALPQDQVQDQETQQNLYGASVTLSQIPAILKQLKTAVESDVDQDVPSYKDAVEDIRTAYTNISRLLDLFANYAAALSSTPGLPQPIVAYGPGASGRATEAKKTITDTLTQISHLKELKELNDFRQQLKGQSILVMTDSSYKILPFDQVWKNPQMTGFENQSDTVVKLNFAGEQQISMAIASLTGGAKPMVVFVRSGGAPLTTLAGPDQEAGPLASVAQRLRDVNFEILEKDASGQAAMRPPTDNSPPEATDEQLKKAVWIVPPTSLDPATGTSPVAVMLKKHLDEGGSALVLMFPQMEAMIDVLGPWGIRPQTGYLLLHAAFPATGRRSLDLVDGWIQGSQAVFKLNQYGQHALTKPLEGLDFVTAISVPILTVDAPNGAMVTPLLPIPSSPQSWATMDLKDISGENKVVFNPKADAANGRPQGDLESTAEAPLYAGAASEKASGGRLVVIGSSYFASNYLVDLPDEEMLKKHSLPVARLPGNGELFVDSVLWLAHKDSLLAISPQALQVARIKELSPASLAFWRIGVLIIGLPGFVVITGMLVYVRRQDK